MKKKKFRERYKNIKKIEIAKDESTSEINIKPIKRGRKNVKSSK